MTAHRLQLRRAAQKKRTKTATLNLVSLMDIFTILVFFLMVNSSEVEVLETSTKIKLPDSVSEQLPKDRLVISVSRDNIVVQGRPVAAVAGLADSKAPLIAGLKQELDYRAARKGAMPQNGYDITIMGDKTIPYWLLKKIMLTCQASDFARISLAVNQLAVGSDGAKSAVATPGTHS